MTMTMASGVLYSKVSHRTLVITRYILCQVWHTIAGSESTVSRAGIPRDVFNYIQCFFNVRLKISLGDYYTIEVFA